MHVYFTTIVRGAPPEAGGELVKVDWNAKRVLSTTPIYAASPTIQDPNPRGSTRGGRGILLNGHEILAASYHTIHVFDRNLKTECMLSHNLFADIHEMLWEDDAIWVTSTAIDAAVKVDRQGCLLDEWWARDDPLLADRYQLPQLPIDRREDNRGAFVGISATIPGHTHLNAMAIHEGRPIVLLNRFGCIAKLFPTELLVDDSTLRGAHNLVVLNNGHIAVNDTINRSVRIYDGKGRPVRTLDLCRLRVVRKILRRHLGRLLGIWLSRHGRPFRLFYGLFGHLAMARPVFVRGLATTDHGTILVGISPAGVLELDPESGEVLDQFFYTTDVNNCIHGLACSRGAQS